MFKFLAKRIHDGFMTIEEVNLKFQAKVKEAYKEMYGEDLA